MLAIVLLLSAIANSQDFSLFKKLEFRKEFSKSGLSQEFILPYRLLEPEQLNTEKKYPLFIFLHGMGKRGTDNEIQLERGAQLFLKNENRKKYPCYALYPQAPKTSAFVEIIDSNGKKFNGGFSKIGSFEDAKKMKVVLSPYGQMVYELIQQLISTGKIDTNRIYISGSSMGGFSTYTFISLYPDLFAAAAPICGGTPPDMINSWAGKVPIWIFHGDADSIVPVQASRLVVEKLNALGIKNFKYSEYPGIEHNSWVNAFSEPDYIKWFFQHKK